jgi:hypothetical protein
MVQRQDAKRAVCSKRVKTFGLARDAPFMTRYFE